MTTTLGIAFLAVIFLLGLAGFWIWRQGVKQGRTDRELIEARRLNIIQARMLEELPKLVGRTDAEIEEISREASRARSLAEANHVLGKILRGSVHTKT